jgi:hypothetical protein
MIFFPERAGHRRRNRLFDVARYNYHVPRASLGSLKNRPELRGRFTLTRSTLLVSMTSFRAEWLTSLDVRCLIALIVPVALNLGVPPQMELRLDARDHFRRQ